MDKRSPLHQFQRTGQRVVEKDDLKKGICRAARGRLCSGHSQRVHVDLFFRFSFDLCVFRPTWAGCTLGNSKASPAPTLLPCGQSEPTKASDLDIHNDHENDIDSDSEYDNDNDNDNDNDKNDKNDDDDNNDDNDKTDDIDIDSDIDSGNDDNDNDEHENVKTLKKFKMWKTTKPFSFHSADVSLCRRPKPGFGGKCQRMVRPRATSWKSFMLKGTVFWPARVVAEVEEKGTITCLYVCVHCKMFLVEDILWWVTAEHEERNISV